MVKPIKQIQQELDHLTAQTQQVSQELYLVYTEYLKAFSQATRQQLILATYHICTQVYPHQFLSLSYSERQKLQEKIRDCVNGLETELLSHLNRLNSDQSALSFLENVLLSLPQSESLTSEKNELTLEEEKEPEPIIYQNPNQLILWCQYIEQGILSTLEQISQKVNQCLQKGKIVSNRLPPKLLEMALQAEEGGINMGNSPNLLNLLVEAKSTEEDESEPEEIEEKITKITAIHLRVSDIEFANPNLTLIRKKLRQLLEKVQKLRQYYQQAEKEYAIAEAEAAWRGSWIDEIL